MSNKFKTNQIKLNKHKFSIGFHRNLVFIIQICARNEFIAHYNRDLNSPESTTCCHVGNLFFTLKDTLCSVITYANTAYRTIFLRISLCLSS